MTLIQYSGVSAKIRVFAWGQIGCPRLNIVFPPLGIERYHAVEAYIRAANKKNFIYI